MFNESEIITLFTKFNSTATTATSAYFALIYNFCSKLDFSVQFKYVESFPTKNFFVISLREKTDNIDSIAVNSLKTLLIWIYTLDQKFLNIVKENVCETELWKTFYFFSKKNYFLL